MWAKTLQEIRKIRKLGRSSGDCCSAIAYGCVNRVSSANAQSTCTLANPTPPVHHTFDVRELSSALVTLVEDLFATESVEIVWQKHKQILAL